MYNVRYMIIRGIMNQEKIGKFIFGERYFGLETKDYVKFIQKTI